MTGNPDLVTWAYWMKSLWPDRPVYHLVKRWHSNETQRTVCGAIVWEIPMTEFGDSESRGYFLPPANAIRMGRACKRCFK